MTSLVAGAIFIISGAALLFLGAMFIIASGESPSRLTAGAAMALSAMALLAAGVRFFMRGLRSGPGAAERAILKAAAKHNGRIARMLLMAETGGGDAVEARLSEMSREGRVSEETIAGKTFCVFPEFQFSLKFKKCPYCGNDYPVREDVEKCPSCGGDLKIVSGKTADGEDKFSMDI